MTRYAEVFALLCIIFKGVRKGVGVKPPLEVDILQKLYYKGNV